MPNPNKHTRQPVSSLPRDLGGVATAPAPEVAESQPKHEQPRSAPAQQTATDPLKVLMAELKSKHRNIDLKAFGQRLQASLNRLPDMAQVAKVPVYFHVEATPATARAVVELIETLCR